MDFDQLNVRFNNRGMVWYNAVGEWPEEREVLYANNTRLVPLLESEVPFSYKDLGLEMVFLLDRSNGVAAATYKFAAAVPKDKVSNHLSALALFGPEVSPEGYCYEYMTGGNRDLGPYPSVAAMRAEGVQVDDSACSFVDKGSGLYHCVGDTENIPYSQLPSHGVVGANTSATSQILAQVVPALKDKVPGMLDQIGAGLAGSASAVLGSQDKVKLRVLQAVGDNVISLILSLRVLDEQGTAQNYQEVRSKASSNAYLCDKFITSPFAGVFRGVTSDVATRVGSGALEALMGVAFMAGGLEASQQLMQIFDIG